MQEKPLFLSVLAVTNLKRRMSRTISLMLIVAFFSFIMFGGSILTTNMKNGTDSISARLGADLMLVPRNADNQFEGALLRGEPSSFYFDASLLSEIRKLPDVASATGQLFISSLDASCCTSKVQLIGFDPDSDFAIRPWLSLQSIKKELADNEVLVGRMIIGKVGDEVSFYDKSFRVAGRLEKTGMGFDTSVFMNLEAAGELLKVAAPDQLHDNASLFSSILVKTKQGIAPSKAAFSILSKYAKPYNIKVIITKAMISEIAAKLQNISWIIYGLTGLIWLLAIAVLFLVFSISFNERIREFSVLRILGATRKKIITLVLYESALISLGGAVTGIILASLIVFPFNILISSSIGLPYLQPPFLEILGLAVGSIFIAFLIGPLSTLGISLRLKRSEIYSLMRENE